MPDYRVTFRHLRSRVTFSVIVPASTATTAETFGAAMLTAHLRRTAGRVTLWAHDSTVDLTNPLTTSS